MLTLMPVLTNSLAVSLSETPGYQEVGHLLPYSAKRRVARRSDWLTGMSWKTGGETQVTRLSNQPGKPVMTSTESVN